MENKNFTDPNENSDWLENLLKTPEVKENISHDQDAVSGSEFRNLADMELEKILQEAKQSDWLDEPVQEEPAPLIAKEPAVEIMPEPVAEPVVEEAVEEPAPVEEPVAEEVVEELAPVEEPVVEEAVEEKGPKSYDPNYRRMSKKERRKLKRAKNG